MLKKSKTIFCSKDERCNRLKVKLNEEETEEEGVQLRKQKREQQLAKRRNVNDLSGIGDDELWDGGVSYFNYFYSF